jgi:hypothetical protein
MIALARMLLRVSDRTEVHGYYRGVVRRQTPAGRVRVSGRAAIVMRGLVFWRQAERVFDCAFGLLLRTFGIILVH